MSNKAKIKIHRSTPLNENGPKTSSTPLLQKKLYFDTPVETAVTAPTLGENLTISYKNAVNGLAQTISSKLTVDKQTKERDSSGSRSRSPSQTLLSKSNNSNENSISNSYREHQAQIPPKIQKIHNMALRRALELKFGSSALS